MQEQLLLNIAVKICFVLFRWDSVCLIEQYAQHCMVRFVKTKVYAGLRLAPEFWHYSPGERYLNKSPRE